MMRKCERANLESRGDHIDELEEVEPSELGQVAKGDAIDKRQDEENEDVVKDGGEVMQQELGANGALQIEDAIDDDQHELSEDGPHPRRRDAVR